MQCKFTVIIYDRMSCICSTLKTDNNICLCCKHICDLAFSLIAPVSAYYCCNHLIFLLHKKSDGL